jgi:cephalosporin-C deacetylase-like acetyl esterase
MASRLQILFVENGVRDAVLIFFICSFCVSHTDLTDSRIIGGKPYRDIEKALKFVIKEFDFLDANRAAAIGASFGGYMINWIQGHDLGRRFKALV